MKSQSKRRIQPSTIRVSGLLFLLLLGPAMALAGCIRKPDSIENRIEIVTPVPGERPEYHRPSIRRVALGHSVQGKPLAMTVFGSRPNPIFIFGGIHGDEPTSAQLARRLVGYLRTNPQIWESTSVAILHSANPDGLARGTRQNSNGVDCNRNFPTSNWQRSRRGDRYYGGPRALSEPETGAIIKAVQTLQPSSIVAIHSMGGGKFCVNYDGPAGDLARTMAKKNHYPPKASIGYATPGSFGTWAGIDRNIPTITLELPQEESISQVWPANRRAFLALFQAHVGR